MRINRCKQVCPTSRKANIRFGMLLYKQYPPEDFRSDRDFNKQMSRESSGITYQRNGGDHMISLTGSFNYYFCTEPVTLRYRHRGLREYIKSKLHRDPTNGDVFIFLSRDYSRLRIYYFHHNGEIL